nr:hypothetical protein [Candidatus Baldrarchaeota archaeon]
MLAMNPPIAPIIAPMIPPITPIIIIAIPATAITTVAGATAVLELFLQYNLKL